MKYTVRVLLILVLSIGQLFAHNNSSDFQKEAITLLGGIAHIDDGTMIENSAIVLENGIIKACVDANKSRIPYKGEIIDIKGKHIYISGTKINIEKYQTEIWKKYSEKYQLSN